MMRVVVRTAAVSIAKSNVCARRTFSGSRGSRGWGWYRAYKENGRSNFVKAPIERAAYDWDPERPEDFSYAYLELNGERVEVLLASRDLPITTENFLRLCTGENEHGWSYKGSKVHRLVRNVGLMTGDVEGGGGMKSHSSFRERWFADESFTIPHSDKGILTMATCGRDTNGSQFLITTQPAPFLDGRCVAFGIVSKGMDVVEKVFESYAINGQPVSSITVTDCGF